GSHGQEVFTQLCWQPEKKCRESVRLGHRGTEGLAIPARRDRRAKLGRTSGEIEPPARARASAALKLGLGMIHLLGVDVHSPADLMRAHGLCKIRSDRELVVIPIVRAVVLFGPKYRITTHVERRPATLESFRSIGAWDAQNVRPIVGPYSRLLHVRVLAGPPEETIHQ